VSLLVLREATEEATADPRQVGWDKFLEPLGQPGVRLPMGLDADQNLEETDPGLEKAALLIEAIVPGRWGPHRIRMVLQLVQFTYCSS